MLANDNKELSTMETKTWDKKEMLNEFEVVSFQSPYVVVIRKWDYARGTLEFTHNPRIYSNFKRD